MLFFWIVIEHMKVVLVPEGHVMTVAFAIELSIHELKRHLASELRVPADVLQISLDGLFLSLLPQVFLQSRTLKMTTSGHRCLYFTVLPFVSQTLPVYCLSDGGVLQEVVVEIERPRHQKAFLGGYRHRLTGVEYHHAAVQTLPKRRPDRGVAVFSRDTQTVELKSQAQQCPVNASTQMTGIGCYVSCMNDRLVTPGKYTTADEYHDRRLRAVIRLQTFARRWLAQQVVDHLRKERVRRLAWLEMQERRRNEEKEEQLRDRRNRWLNPKRQEDFNLLYQALEKSERPCTLS
uniref:IQ motif and ubiquitin domain containing n=1 Tax=Oreochromis aureus TaxID=47969 RepID=A0AAZ1WZ73_OREAU